MLEKAVRSWGLRLRIFLFFALIAGAALALLVAGLFWLHSRLTTEDFDAAVLAVGSAAFAITGLIAWVWLRFDDHVARPVDRLAMAMRSAAHAGAAPAIPEDLGRYLGALAPAAREIAAALAEARGEMKKAIETATAEGERQKSRLEAVLRDLQQGVIICRFDHSVLLYNRAAQTLIGRNHADNGAPTGGELGLGRDLTTLIAPQPLRHSLERLTRRFVGGRHLSHRDGLMAPFVAVTTSGHETLKGRMSLMLDDSGANPVGYVVTLDAVTQELAAGIWRERLLQDVTQDMREHVTTLTMAGEMLLSGRPLAADERAAVEAALREEPVIIGERLDRLDQVAGDLLSSAWPMAPVFSLTLFDCIANRRSEGRSITVELGGTPIWLLCDSTSVTELLDRIMNRAAVWDQVRAFRLEAASAGDRAHIDLVWQGAPVPVAMLETWLDETLDETLGSMTGRDVLNHHKSDMWCEAIAEADGRPAARIRMALAIARDLQDRPEKANVEIPARPEFYDFDLLARHPAGRLEDIPLRALTYVVFDTETTGLEPSRGDEMVAIAGVRIVNGRLLRGEVFSTLVNPGRKIPSSSARIHGITDELVADAAPAAAVLPRFRDFVGDGVLIAHNAPFDMAFLEKRQTDAGVNFDGPVLDTVLLAAHIFGRSESLTLDALAARFGIVIPPETRHTALGDSLATAEVLLKLIDLLEPAGVVTLGDASRACDMQAAIRRKQSAY